MEIIIAGSGKLAMELLGSLKVDGSCRVLPWAKPHQITVEHGETTLAFVARVYGDAPYADGVSSIIEAVRTHKLENRLYRVTEFIDNGWL